MGPGGFRRTWGFAALSAAPIALFAATPALAQSGAVTSFLAAAPLAILLGGGSVALIAAIAFHSLRRRDSERRRQVDDRIAGLRALVDQYEALLSGTREITILWSENPGGPKFFGQASAVLPQGRHPETVLDFGSWATAKDADTLARALESLRVGGHAFDTSLKTLDGRIIRASGWVMGGGAALRLRPAYLQPESEPNPAEKGLVADLTSARSILSQLSKPAFVRDVKGRLIYANSAYLQVAEKLGRAGTDTAPPELLEPAALKRHLAAVGEGGKAGLLVSLPAAGAFDLVEFPIAGGTAGYLRPRPSAAKPENTTTSHIGGIIDALSTPIAIFNAQRELVQHNPAYAQLWRLDPQWLRLGLDERAILDRLRNDNMLPNEPNYQEWRAKHLTSYTLSAPRESEPWHLPDGRTIKVISAPAGPNGGVIYVFEDQTERLKLESLNKALSNVQRETLNALSEGVAVFGTNGRLTLSNPRLSALWKLPMNELGQSPHIDQIAEASARAMPEDGATIWRDLKRGIIDLNPTRSDTTGRITRADGRLLDYAITRLPDGQTMMTFLDVTESASYSRVLKERNDALVTADRLKDAFVQSVSYELRSPLTNIIGFADLLASPEVGDLNERQRSYTDYIRASSVTLGVLIDNILDLATVDAGIAELRPEVQDVHALVDKARAGLAATFPEINGEKPINLSVEIPHGLPTFVADGTRIVQILYNLLSNAARFSEPGAEIRLIVTSRAERMLFIIEDEGPGMSEEMRAAITERIDSHNIAGRQRGAGLGLAIVRTFVNLHGGTISVEKREPRGTRVIVNLPRDAAMAGVAE
jgi:signal transduction histidine kinase